MKCNLHLLIVLAFLVTAQNFSFAQKKLLLNSDFKDITITTAGDLKKALENESSVTKLRLHGQINATDLYTMQKMKQLTDIDLSDAIIKEGGWTFFNGEQIMGKEGVLSDGTFYNHSKLKTISLPNNTTEIGSYAFSSTSIESINFPASLKKLGACVFMGSKNLKRFEIAAGCPLVIDNNSCIYSSDLKKVYAFAPMSTFSEYKIKDGTEIIEAGAFYGAKNLTKITLPSSLKEIGVVSFCFSSIEEINIPYQVASIGMSTFYGCNKLREARIEGNINKIQDQVFMNCSLLQHVTLPNSIENIAVRSFKGCESLSNIKLPESLKEIGENAFLKCSSLKEIIFPNSLTSIGKAAFMSCSSLSSIKFDGCTISIIPESAFDYCKSLKKFNFPQGLKLIEKNAFFSAAEEELVIPEGVTTIGISAFNENTNLKNLILPSTLQTLDDFSFRDCNKLVKVKLPASLRNLGTGAFSWCESLSSITIEDGLEHISDNAFARCDMQQITFPKSIKSIGRASFAFCKNLKDLNIVANIKKIEKYAFADCYQLTNVSFENNTELVDSVFHKSTNIKEVKCNGLEPINGGENSFSTGVYSNAKLIVPSSACEKYKNTTPWKFFNVIIPTGTESPTEEKRYSITDGILNVWSKGQITVYDINGHTIGSSRKEISIPIYNQNMFIIKTDKENYKIILKH